MQKIKLNSYGNLEESECVWNDIKSIWGVSPLAPIHLGYDSQILIQKEGINKGIKDHTIIIADLHTMMDKGYSHYEIKKRGYYFEFYMREVCKLKNTKFIWGSEFQTRPLYTEMMYSILPNIKWRHILKAMPNEMRKSGNYSATSALYPVMQCLDVLYNKANFVFGDIGQMKIYNLLHEFLKEKNYVFYAEFKKLLEEMKIVYYPVGHDIKGRRLVESTSDTRISVHDNDATLNHKIINMFAPYGRNLTSRPNALLETYKYSVFPWIMDIGSSVNILSKKYDSFEDFENDYNNKVFHPIDAKKILFEVLKKRLAYIQSAMNKGITNWIDYDKL